MARPNREDYSGFNETYVSLVPEENIIQALYESVKSTDEFLNSIPKEKYNYSYGPGKWTIKQMLQHVIDAERVFSYRALCVARGEKQNLPGFDENVYAAAADAKQREFSDLVDEFKTVRKSNIMMFEKFTPEMMNAKGLANNNSISANALAYIIVGHWRHHQRILKERYL
ncbi:MAG: damage-inducible protein DinB [Bacteroidetes bacterium]|nr:MAG: damage-inducible protein DinB [Bacteroidota bacterium]